MTPPAGQELGRNWNIEILDGRNQTGLGKRQVERLEEWAHNVWIFVSRDNTHGRLWQTDSQMDPVFPVSSYLYPVCVIPFSLLWADLASTASQGIMAKMVQCHCQITSHKIVTSILLGVFSVSCLF